MKATENVCMASNGGEDMLQIASIDSLINFVRVNTPMHICLAHHHKEVRIHWLKMAILLGSIVGGWVESGHFANIRGKDLGMWIHPCTHRLLLVV